jgi:cell wall assembly regulator SMI1
MVSPLRRELRRLLKLLDRLETPVTPLKGASNDVIARVEKASGIRFDDDLRDLYRFSNGGRRTHNWFAVVTDELQLFRFSPLKEVKLRQSQSTSFFDPDWNNGDVPWSRRHRRLNQHTKWLPFADFGNGNAALYFDADPTKWGSYGQVLSYQHDPDAIRYVAPSVLAFLKQSNDLIEAHAEIW